MPDGDHMTTLTDQLWERFGTLTLDGLPPDVLTVAQQCVLDWTGCALAGSREPLSSILRDELATDAGPCADAWRPSPCRTGDATP